MKHTPGPWIIKILPDYFSIHAYSPSLKDDVAIAQVGFYQSEANAHLIAAAPDLLDAAKSAAALIRGCAFTENAPTLIQLTAAIIKAEGK